MVGSKARRWAALGFLCTATSVCGAPSEPSPANVTWDLTVDLYYYCCDTVNGVQRDVDKSAKFTGFIVSSPSLRAQATCGANCPYTVPTPLVYDQVSWRLEGGAITLMQGSYGNGIWFYLDPKGGKMEDAYLAGDAYLTWGSGRSAPYHQGTFKLIKRQ